MQGTDQVVGQILRYMGWVKETHRTEKVRGIIIVGRKEQALVVCCYGRAQRAGKGVQNSNRIGINKCLEKGDLHARACCGMQRKPDID